MPVAETHPMVGPVAVAPHPDLPSVVVEGVLRKGVVGVEVVATTVVVEAAQRPVDARQVRPPIIRTLLVGVILGLPVAGAETVVATVELEATRRPAPPIRTQGRLLTSPPMMVVQKERRQTTRK